MIERVCERGADAVKSPQELVGVTTERVREILWELDWATVRDWVTVLD